jgi:hypothetical protein
MPPTIWSTWSLLVLLLFTPRHGATLQDLPLRFQLRHQHAISNSTKVIFSNVPTARANTPESYSIHTRTLTTYRPPSLVVQGHQGQSSRWVEDEVLGPDVEKRAVLLELAKMTNNAYLMPGEEGWYDLGDEWSPVSDILVVFKLVGLTRCRDINLVGNRTRMGSVATSLQLMTTRPWCCLLRAPRLDSSVEAARQLLRISSTITCCLAVAAPRLIGHGNQSVDAIEKDGTVI